MKRFQGKVIDHLGREKPIQFQFSARPRDPENAVLYMYYPDEDFFGPRGVATFHRLGQSTSSLMSSKAYGDCLCEEFKKDPHFFLQPESRKIVQTLYSRFGAPFTMEAIEGRSVITAP